LLTACLALQQVVGDRLWLAATLEGLAAVAAGRIHAAGPEGAGARRALRLAGAASAVRERFGPTPSAHAQARLARWLTPARLALGEESATAAWREGQAMAPDDATAYALGDEADG